MVPEELMPEESDHRIRVVKRIQPGALLFGFIVLVSALLIYKIQSQESVPVQSETTSSQTKGEPAYSVPQSDSSNTQPEETETDREIPNTSLSQTTPQTELVLTQTANRQPLLPDVGTLKKGELESTSWQNPFYRLLWKSKGWKFTDEGMVSTPEQISAATFVRPYQKISVSFAVEVEQRLPAFELQLLTRDPAHPEKVLVTSSVHFQHDSVSVSAELKDATKELKRNKLHLEASPKSKRVRIRFVGTGNRFVISVGRHRVLTCTQPAQQSGKECYLSFLADADPVKITALRIEGE
ncbi:hypothetical protein Pan241w_50380 [Gimesia alba]|uniref:Uncharacterized protein n=1 Tax=Gimesia alba TaxID=2527973 RepID=A0A517RMA2_9PLAN|nr:hypothetical protein [Gimesia alba]QDT44922.1 hypothetical protein Pan241w_50380 [Gimesia alba]